MRNKVDVNEFSLAQMVSNQNGKTSAPAVAGLWLILVGTICFAWSSYTYVYYKTGSDVLIQSLGMATLGTSLLVTRRLKPTKDATNTENNEVTNN